LYWGIGNLGTENPDDAFDHGAMLSIRYQLKLHKWRIANARSRVDVRDHLRECRTENINTRNSSGDEIANVNFFYDDIVHKIQSTRA